LQAAFAGLFYLSLYLAAKLHVLDNRGEVWKTFIVLVPTLGAALIADSRIMDARHHPFDVLSGSLLGIVVAWCSYRQYFPPVSEYWKKGRAYPIRTWGRPPLHPNDRESAEEGLEPLREPGMTLPDEEAGMAGYSSSAASPAMLTSGENVFRKQVSDTQRHRQHEFRAGSSGSQPYVQNTPPPPPEHTTPLVSSRGSGHRTRDDDDYMSSSSEDHGEGYELEQSYSLTSPHNQPTVESFSAPGDTSHHPPAQPVQLEPTQAKITNPRLSPHRKPVMHSGEDNIKPSES
jgi:diacylglycerol diphosphate phosphatase/phosphatidate phosphatase